MAGTCVSPQVVLWVIAVLATVCWLTLFSPRKKNYSCYIVGDTKVSRIVGFSPLYKTKKLQSYYIIDSPFLLSPSPDYMCIHELGLGDKGNWESSYNHEQNFGRLAFLRHVTIQKYPTPPLNPKITLDKCIQNFSPSFSFV